MRSGSNRGNLVNLCLLEHSRVAQGKASATLVGKCERWSVVRSLLKTYHYNPLIVCLIEAHCCVVSPNRAATASALLEWAFVLGCWEYLHWPAASNQLRSEEIRLPPRITVATFTAICDAVATADKLSGVLRVASRRRPPQDWFERRCRLTIIIAESVTTHAPERH